MDQDASLRRTNKVTLCSLLNYLQAGHKGISKYDMDNFLGENKFSIIFQELLHNSIVTENEHKNYVLNDDIKDLLAPLLHDLTH